MGCCSSKEEKPWLQVNDNERNIHPSDKDTFPDKDPKPQGNRPSPRGIKYNKTSLGTYEAYLDTRHNPRERERSRRPLVKDSTVYTDRSFPIHVAIADYNILGLEWRRPKEFAKNPVLFSDGTSRFDIAQGSIGTCWFLSVIANLSEKKELLDRVITSKSYSSTGDDYDGIFHCKFWRFGNWHDVYIDDQLPIGTRSKELWGVRSATDKNEMWPSLLEKAIARFYGSYNDVDGGQPSDSYLALTGGVSERIVFETNKIESVRLFQRVRHAINSGCLVTCAVMREDLQDVFGLIGKHAYSLTGTTVVETRNGDRHRLLRVRNPWGFMEWKGSWSDKSRDWSNVVPPTRGPPEKTDGEFWVSLEDFLRYFYQLTISSITPDIDLDGREDNLNYISCIYGEWFGRTAAGYKRYERNPRYIFTLSDEHRDDDGRCSIAIQLIQQSEDRLDDFYSINCFLLEKQGKDYFEKTPSMYSPFINDVQITQRYRLRTGTYVVLPSTYDAGNETEYLIRIFTTAPFENIGQEKLR